MDKKTTLAILKDIGWLVFLVAVISFITAMFDMARFLQTYGRIWESFFTDVAMYFAFYLFVALPLAFIKVSSNFFIQKKRQDIDNKFFYIVFFTTLSLLLIIGSYLDYNYFPVDTNSLIYYFLFIVVYSLFAIALYRFLSKKGNSFWLVLKIWLITLFVMCFSLLSFWAFSKGKIPLLKAKNFYEGENNVLIISIDALRADHLSCYGYRRKTSPTIDDLAAQGILFTEAYSHSTHTAESVPSLLLSLYPSTHNLNTARSALPPNTYNIFLALKKFGITTAIFSQNPVLTAFQGWNCRNGIDYNFSKYSKQGKAISFPRNILYTLERRTRNKALISTHLFLRSFIARLAFNRKSILGKKFNPIVRFERFVLQNRNKPFFAYIHLMHVHAPYISPSPYNNIFSKQGETKGGYISFWASAFYPFNEGTKLTKQEREGIITRYDQGILYTDKEQVAAILKILKKQGIFEKTFIILTADHGEEFYEHKMWRHGGPPFRTLIHVPLIMYFKNFASKGLVINSIVRQVDLFPTILDFYNIPVPSSLEGKSLLPIIKGDQNISSRFAFSEVKFKNNWARSLIQGDFHLIVSQYDHRSRELLYNFKEDPGELNDISEVNVAKRREMQKVLNEVYRQSKNKSIRVREIILDREIIKDLKALGYLQ